MLADLRYAIRTLLATPGFTLVAVLSLALGIGANTAIFSAANGLLLRPVVEGAPAEVVRVYRNRHSPLQYDQVVALRGQVPAIRRLAGERILTVGRTDGPEPVKVAASIVVGDYFAVMRASPAAGRLFGAGDTTAASRQMVVLGYRYWRSAFAGDPAVVGRALRLNGQPFTVIGVAPERLTSTMLIWAPELYFPVAATAPLLGVEPRDWGGSIYTIAELVPGATSKLADAQLAVAARRLAAADTALAQDQRFTFRTGTARGLVEELRGASTAAATFLLVLVTLVLLIACANIANLLLARATARQRELGVRAALGAGRMRLVRQLLVESLLLALAGGAVALLLVTWLTPGLGAWLSSQAPEAVLVDFRPDQRVLAYATLLSVGAAVAFGLVPALRASRPDVVAALRQGGRGATEASRLRAGLLTAQVALCTVVLAGAGLFVHSLRNARHMDPGFPTAGVLDMLVDLRTRRMAPAAERELFGRLAAEARALPGARGAALAQLVPLGGSNMETGLWIEGRERAAPGAPLRMTHFNVVGDGYFRTLAISLPRGREFTAGDDSAAARVVVVNETFAARTWPGVDPIGRRVSVDGPEGPWRTVVGVARDTRYNSLGEATPTFLYLPYAQQGGSDMVLHVRAAPGNEATVAAALRRIVGRLDPLLPPGAPVPIEHDMAVSLLPARIAATLLGAFGALALLLASVGVYGVTSYTVARRTREIGIRAALGATRTRMLSLVVGRAARSSAWGLAIGLVLALGLSAALRSQLYGVGVGDPLTFLVTPAVLLAVTVAAAWLPARRAARVDPAIALRAE